MLDGIRKIDEYVITPGRSLVLNTNTGVKFEDLPNGTVYINGTNGEIKIKKAGETDFEFSSPRSVFGDGRMITSDLIALNSIDGSLIRDAAISTKHLGTKQITEIKMADNSISNRTILDGAITYKKIEDGSITYEKMFRNSVGADQIRSKCIVAGHIADSNIYYDHLDKNLKNLFNMCLKDIYLSDAIDLNNSRYVASSKAVKTAYDKGVEAYNHATFIKNSNTTDLNDFKLNIANTLKTKQDKLPALTSAHANKTVHISSAGNTFEYRHMYVESSKQPTAPTNGMIWWNTSKNKAYFYVRGAFREVGGDNNTVNGHLRINSKPGQDQSAGCFYVGPTAPASQAVTLNYNGIFRATRVHNAVYMDIAELFLRGEETEPGDIIMLGEDGKYVKAVETAEEDCIAVGAESDEYGYLLGGDGSEDYMKNFIPVALCGRINVKALGQVNKGDYIIPSSTPGVGVARQRSSNYSHVSIGIALETKKCKLGDKVRVLVK